jgi:hypothetical protein
VAAHAGKSGIRKQLRRFVSSLRRMHNKTQRFARAWPTRLTAQAALKVLNEQGYSEEQLPSPSTMAAVLNRMGFRLRKVVKAKPQKKIKETDAIVDNIKKRWASRVIGRRQTLEYRL